MGITIYPFYGGGNGGGSGAGGSSVSLDGPLSLYVGQDAQWQITDFDVFSEYVVQASAGTISIDGDVIDYTAPAVAGEVALTITVNGVARAVAVEILPAGIAAPTGVSPTAGVTDIGETPTLTSSAFAAIGLSDTHAASRWRVYLVYPSVALVHDSDWSASALTSYAVPSGVLSVNTVYAWTVEHRGAVLGDSPPSAATGFTTATVFWNPYDPANIGQPRAGGFFIGVMKYADGDYELIDAGKASETSLVYNASNTVNGGTTSYHDGLANSSAMNSASWPAAKYCLDGAWGGQSDWYLPARDEAELRYRNLKPSTASNITGARPESGNYGENANSVPTGAAYAVGSPAQTALVPFRAGGAEALNGIGTWYWTSTQYAPSTSGAWIQRCSDGYQYDGYKLNSYLVRPVRRLKI